MLASNKLHMDPPMPVPESPTHYEKHHILNLLGLFWFMEENKNAATAN